jgi:hypothetical protein
VAVLGETQLQEPWRRDGARYRPGEGVVGQVQLLQAGRERVVGDLPGEPVPGQVEHLELGQRGHVGERARETVAGEAERPQVFFYIYIFSTASPPCQRQPAGKQRFFSLQKEIEAGQTAWLHCVRVTRCRSCDAGLLRRSCYMPRDRV